MAFAYSAERQFIAATAKSLIERVLFDLWIYSTNLHPDLTRFADDLAVDGLKVRLISQLALKNTANHLMHSPFGRGKSFGKFNSYMIVGFPLVVQDALDYPELFIEKSGMLDADIDDWVETIFETLTKPLSCDSIAAQARLDFDSLLSRKKAARNIDVQFGNYLCTVD